MRVAETRPLVGVIMGSKSDWDAMSKADAILTEFGVAHECHVLSAHRTPAQTAEYASTAASRGLEVIIAGAGGAAHLAGVVAAHTVLPVIGVPMQSSALNGLDSLLSTVQMPKGIPGRDRGDRPIGRGQRGAARRRHPCHVASGAARKTAGISRRAGGGSRPANALLKSL